MSPASNFDEEGEQGNTQGAVQDTSIDDGDESGTEDQPMFDDISDASMQQLLGTGTTIPEDDATKSSDSPWTEVDTRRMHFNGRIAGISQGFSADKGVSTRPYLRTTPRCNIVASYFDNFHFIDVHDHMRQGI